MHADNNTEQRMRDLLTQHATSTPGLTDRIDTDRVIARVRRRRLPRQAAIGGVSALAVVGLLTVAIPMLGGDGMFAGEAPMSASTLESEEGVHDNSGIAPDSARDAGFDVCGSPTGDASSAAGYSVQLDVITVSPLDNGVRIHVDVELSNTSDVESSAQLTTVLFTLSRDGVAVGYHEWAVNDAPGTEFGPGDATEYSAVFTPTPCDPTDTLTGELVLSATLDIGGKLATGDAVTVTTP